MSTPGFSNIHTRPFGTTHFSFNLDAILSLSMSSVLMLFPDCSPLDLAPPSINFTVLAAELTCIQASYGNFGVPISLQPLARFLFGADRGRQFVCLAFKTCPNPI